MPRYETITVTPQLAKQWLGKNADNNRNAKRTKIPSYARDMINGNWNSDTGETIKFDFEGELIDGQNRLQAVIMAGVPVAFDVPRRAMQVIDTGATRTAGDAMKIAGVHDRFRGSAVVRWVIMWDAKVFTGSGGSFMPTNSEIMQRFEQEPGAFDAATRRGADCQSRGLGNGSASGTAHYLFGRIDMDLTHSFFDQYIAGANLPDRSPILALRNRIARIRVDRLTRAEQLALFIRAWNATREGRPLDRMSVTRAGDLSNLNFPQPK